MYKEELIKRNYAKIFMKDKNTLYFLTIDESKTQTKNTFKDIISDFC